MEKDKAIRDLVREAGVTGAGGAGFPTHVKISAGAEVIIGRSDPNATLVPLGAVSVEGNKTYAYVKKAESFEKREVQLGMRNPTHAVVLAGLNVGDELRID